MPQATASAAEINRQFVERMMICAADIVFYDQPFGQPDAVDALLRAKTELLAEEPADQKVRRTYGGAEIIPDFGQYVASQHPEFIPPEGFGTIITPWCRSQTSRTVAETLRAGSQTIGVAVARRTAIAEQRKCFNDRELEQLETLDQLSDFLLDQGIAADIQGRKPYDAYPAEFHGQINGTRWSLAVAQLTHAGARFNADIEQPSNPVQSALNFAAQQAGRYGFRTSAAGARRCLVIHNREFTSPFAWEGVCLPMPPYDAVALMHYHDVTATQVWQIQPANCFGAVMPSRTVRDLYKAVQRRLKENPDVNPENLRRAWAAVADSGLTEEDIRRIAKGS